ncbi:MAG: hypothetical protein ABII90_03625 [Bacteroidota bacterium]
MPEENINSDTSRSRECREAHKYVVSPVHQQPFYGNPNELQQEAYVSERDIYRNPDFIYRKEKIIEVKGAISLMREQPDLGDGYRDRFRTHGNDLTFGNQSQISNLIVCNAEVPQGYTGKMIRYYCQCSIPQIDNYFEYAILIDNATCWNYEVISAGQHRFMLEMFINAKENSRIQLGAGLTSDADDIVVQDVWATGVIILYCTINVKER